MLVPCIAHGDYVKVESLAADHLQAKEDIIKRQADLIEKLNEDRDFADFIMKQPGMKKFFVKLEDEKYYGTLFFYELYFNDIDNIWLICSACNLQKSNEETLDWFKNQWLYGQEFIDFIAKNTIKETEGILIKIANKKGLAETAIEWFWDRHANYISIAQKLQENIITPIKLLNIKVDHIIGLGSQQRIERAKASLDAKMEFTANMSNAKGLGMPKGNSESDHSSSDDEQRMTPIKDSTGKDISVTPRTYLEVAMSTAQKIPVIAKEMMKEEFAKKHAAKQLQFDTPKNPKK